MFKKAFTLAEMLITLIIISILIITMMRNVNFKNYNSTKNSQLAWKTIELVDETLTTIRTSETDYFENRTFITKNPVNNEYHFASTQDGIEVPVETVLSMFLYYVKSETNIVNFCDITTGPICYDSNIKGAKLAGNIVIGIKKLNKLQTCPQYRLPNDDTFYTPQKDIKISKTGTIDHEIKLCWGIFYIDVNGKNIPNKIGEDIFIFGLDRNGLAR